VTKRTLFFILPLIGTAALAPALSGCSYWKAHQAGEAYAEYQQALAAGDLNGAQLALTKLVRTQEDVPDYWSELGRIDLQLGNYRGAYDALSRAHELDRSNVEIIATLAQLAVYAGEIDLADTQAKNLALLAPDHPTVTLVEGFVALKRGNLDRAEQDADKLIAQAPKDSISKILKARVLVSRGQIDQAVTMLEDQHRMVPKDRAAIRALSSIYRARGDWNAVARIEGDLHALDPKDKRAAQALVEALLRAGEVNRAAQVSSAMLSSAAPAQLVADTLDLWSRFAPSGTVLPNGAAIAQASSGERRTAFADYFNRIRKPDMAEGLLGGAQLPVNHDNSNRNAVLARALALQGRTGEAKKLFDLVLAVEPDQLNALRGRSELLAGAGDFKQAIIDAQRLVTANPDNGGDRLLLARAFLAAGNRRQVRRTLWDAFQDVPEDDRVVSALANVLASTGQADAARRLQQEVMDRRQRKLSQELV
jgi:tetratricopeptide (TPR) repeat protein